MLIYYTYPRLRSAVADCRAAVLSGRGIAEAQAAGGYSVRVQETTRWNSRASKLRVHVWHQGKLMRQADWLAVAANQE